VSGRTQDGERAFCSAGDFDYFISQISKYKTRFKIKVYAFCLLPESVDLVIEPVEWWNMSAFIRCLNQSFSRYLNGKYQRDGALWQERFRSVVLKSDYDLVECVKYIEFKPVENCLAQSPVSYRWSSCALRVAGQKRGIIDGFSCNDWFDRGDLDLMLPFSP
jgi:putative transposase